MSGITSQSHAATNTKTYDTKNYNGGKNQSNLHDSPPYSV